MPVWVSRLVRPYMRGQSGKSVFSIPLTLRRAFTLAWFIFIIVAIGHTEIPRLSVPPHFAHFMRLLDESKRIPAIRQVMRETLALELHNYCQYRGSHKPVNGEGCALLGL
jgi:hypothetical protein